MKELVILSGKGGTGKTSIVGSFAALALIFLLIPIAVIILFSFNDPQSRFNFTWHGFTLDYWKDPFGVPGLTDALVKSIEIAALSTVIATALGTMMAKDPYCEVYKAVFACAETHGREILRRRNSDLRDGSATHRKVGMSSSRSPNVEPAST